MQPPSSPEDPPRDVAPRPTVRGALALIPCAASALLGAGAIALVALLLPGFARRHLHLMLRAWGRVPLAWVGVRVELHGREHLEAPGPKLVLFSHASLLDLFLVAAVAPPRPMVLYKAEFGRVPLIGWALRAIGSVPIERGDRERAIASVTRSGALLAERRGTLLVSPEGTRSRTGELQPFKLGAFHLAAEHHFPVVPLVLQGAARCLPMGSFLARAGTVRIDALPPIDTSGWSAARVREHARETRALFLALVPGAPDEPYAEVRSE